MGETVGQALRRVRTSRGLSLRTLATAVNYNHVYLFEIETGRKRPRREIIKACDDHLQAAGQLVKLAQEDEVDRRALLSAASVAASGMFGTSLVNVIDAGKDALAQTLRRHLLLRDVRTQTTEPRKPRALEQDLCQVHGLYQRAEYAAAVAMLPQLIADAENHTIASPSRNQSHRTLAAANLAASKLAAKLGVSDLAWLLADRAVTSARLIADAPLRAVASAQAAISLARDAERLGDAEAMVEAEYDQLVTKADTDAMHLSAVGNLLLVSSTIAARRKQRGAAEQCIDQAAKLALKLGRDSNHLWTAFGPTNVELHRVAAAVALGLPSKAIASADRIDTSGLPSALLSRRAQLHLDVASAYYQSRDGDASAVLHLLEAERIAPQVVSSSHGSRTLVHSLLLRERRSATPGLRPLAQRIGLHS